MDTANNSLTLLSIFFVGLGLNLTPCVYPMLSVTLSLFGAKQEDSRARAFFRSLIYVLGMATMYSSLGVATAFTGGFFGAILQNKIVLLVISALLFLLALSSFGVYTLQAPSAILTRLAGKRGTSYVAIFFSGLFVGLFAAPCIGPPILALMAFVAQKADPLFAFWTFFILSLGLGFPYLLLGTFSGLLRRIPRSGVWLLWVEHLFGVILLSVSAFYFVLAIQPALLKWILPVCLVLGGLYLGFIERSTKYSPAFNNFKKIAGTIAIIVGVALPFFAPKASVVWETYTPEKLAQATQAGKPVLLDFYADWCIPCHEMEQFTYSNPRVIKALAGFERLKVDLTNPDQPGSAQVIEQFEVLGVPTTVFIDPQGKEIEEIRGTGFISANDFLEILDSPRFKK